MKYFILILSLFIRQDYQSILDLVRNEVNEAKEPQYRHHYHGILMDSQAIVTMLKSIYTQLQDSVAQGKEYSLRDNLH